MAKDIFQAIDSLDPAGIQRIVDRLEFRGAYAPFVAMRDAYLERMELERAERVLELGCGTGVVARALAARPGFRGTIVATDFSPALIDVARRHATAEGVAGRIEFRVEDAQTASHADASYDAAIAHTLVSHVPSPQAVVAQLARLVRPGGTVAVFDGDYASLTLSSGDHALDAEMTRAVLGAVVAQPLVMRELPAIARAAGLRLQAFLPAVLAEAGKADFFGSMAESYGPMAARAGLTSQEKAQRWTDALREASARDCFFGSCNFPTYLLRKES